MTIKIINADVMAGLAELADDSVDCIITSPPYWGLRDYGVDGQIGQEETLAAHIETIVAVGEELRRVLKPGGTFWLNYGDCYAYGPKGGGHTENDKQHSNKGSVRNSKAVPGGLKPKDLMMLPARIAIALQEAGWWLRAENIWGKPNPMPESTRDRPAVAHEKIYMLTKSARYFYDRDAVRVAAKYIGLKGMDPSGFKDPRNFKGKHKAGYRTAGKQRGHGRRHAGFNERWDGMKKAEQQAGGRNLRNYERAPVTVWEMAAHPFKEAHFATFPPELVERCIKAGCPSGGLVLDPFGGAGTTALVADRMQRDAILIELNPEYCDIARARINADRGGLLDVAEDELRQVDWVGGER